MHSNISIEKNVRINKDKEIKGICKILIFVLW